jgi:flagellar hook-basal body complex protein FliE
MSAIPSPALALARAFDHFEQSSARALSAAQGDDGELVSAMTDMRKAKIEVIANVAVIRFSDEMWKALLDIGRPPRSRYYD